ncbi:unnamed protein product [Prorocentrum cordatum]|uniref:Uncharacterized protein n=1 Tax=Prorocentrum cordatum TaxID=2364126 RepID=A0ABN9SM47_9DINO|nr:unnamed protein product [Polarella glacialis]
MAPAPWASGGHSRAATATPWTCLFCSGRDGQACMKKASRTGCSMCGLAEGSCFLGKVESKEPSRRVLPAPTQREKDLRAREAALRMREAALETTEKEAQAVQKGPAAGGGDSPGAADTAKADRLRADLEALGGMEGTGVEQPRAEKREQLRTLQAARLAAKPVHIQLKELDEKLQRKLHVVERLELTDIPAASQKVASLQAEHAKAAAEAAELQKQQDTVVLAAVPSAMPKEGASQTCRARAALELSENLGELLVGDSAGPYKVAVDALVAAAKVPDLDMLDWEDQAALDKFFGELDSGVAAADDGDGTRTARRAKAKAAAQLAGQLVAKTIGKKKGTNGDWPEAECGGDPTPGALETAETYPKENLSIMGANVNAWSSLPALLQWVDAESAAGRLADARSRAPSPPTECGRRLGVALPGGIALLSVYCEISFGAKCNTGLLGALAKLALSLDVMWVVQGDWNMTLEELGEFGFLPLERGALVVPESALCSSCSDEERRRQDGNDAAGSMKGARTIDYFVESKLADLRSQKMAQVPVRFKPFEVHPLIGPGPKLDELPLHWSWPAGTREACPVEQMAQEWFTLAEQKLPRDQGID